MILFFDEKRSPYKNMYGERFFILADLIILSINKFLLNKNRMNVKSVCHAELAEAYHK